MPQLAGSPVPQIFWEAGPKRVRADFAQLLRKRYDERPGSWLNAAARYHRPAGGAPAARYRKLVSRHLQQATSP